MSKRRKHKRTRAKVKNQLQQQLAPLARVNPLIRGPHGGAGAVHVCGSKYVPDGLTPMQRDLVREATALQRCKAQGEVQSSHMMVQEHFGWTVHTFNPAMPNRQTLDGRTTLVDERVTSDAYSRALADNKRITTERVQSDIARLRSLRQTKSLTSNIEVNQDLWGDDE